MLASLMTFLGNAIEPGHLEIFRRITDELGLEEIPEVVDFVERISEFLSTPQETSLKLSARQKRGRRRGASTQGALRYDCGRTRASAPVPFILSRRCPAAAARSSPAAS